jgi:Flp pilus assembly protein TadG
MLLSICPLVFEMFNVTRYHFRRLLKDQRGGVAMIFALSLPTLLGLAGLALDYANLNLQHTKLKSIADAAALAGAREFRLANASVKTVTSASANFAKASLDAASIAASISPSADLANRTVKVDLATTVESYIIGFLGKDVSSISATATAKVVGVSPVCAIALDTKANQSMLLDKNAKLEAVSCSVYSNSKKPSGLMAKNNASISAAFICSSGGKSSPGPGSFRPEPQTDCPAMPDPLLSRALPAVGSCGAQPKLVNGGALTITPGTYCGGLTLTNGANVQMQPGVYVFRDGPLLVTGGATLNGTNVGLHFSGSGAVLKLDPLSNIALTAPQSGDTAGILVSEDRGTPAGQTHEILSDNARTLLGTIYLPQNRFHVGANKPVSDKSAYTIVVARLFTLSEGPTMVLNSNYNATNIPVPDGVGPTGSRVSLTQ